MRKSPRREWEPLLHAPDETLERIDQLAIEFHFTDEERFARTVRRLKEFFYVAHLHFNNHACDPRLMPFPSWAYEVLLVNRRLGRLIPGTGAARAAPIGCAEQSDRG